MKKTDFIYRGFRAVLLSLTVLLTAGSYLGIPSLTFPLVLLAIILPPLFFFFMGSKLKGRLMVLAFVLLFLIFVAAFFGFRRSLEFIAGFPGWMSGGEWPEVYGNAYPVVQGVLVILGCCIADLVFSLSPYTTGVPALLVLALLVYYYIVKEETSRAEVVFAFSFIFTSAAEVIERFWRKRKSGQTYRYMQFLLPFFLVFLLLLIPAAVNKKDPYDWKFVVKAYERISQEFNKITERIEFGRRGAYGFTHTGFSEDGNVGSGVSDSEREIFVLRPNSALKTGLYLAGQSYSRFDGMTWSGSGEAAEDAVIYDTIRLLYGLRRADPEHMQDYISPISIGLETRYFRSDHIFMPLKTRRLQLPELKKREYVTEREDAIVFSKKKGYGTLYTFSFYEVNSRMQYFREMISKDLEEEPTLLRSLLQDEKTLGGSGLTVDAYKRRAEEIRENYIEAPVLTDRVRAKLQEITKDAKTPEDRLYAIESYLAGLRYESYPGPLPETVTDAGSFLDYFLFERPVGYCTYFATAFVLMARAEGFPARYVQGFVADHTTVQPFAVYSNMSHAWPEVWFENTGWIGFEPTPGYGGFRYRGWKVYGRGGGSGSGNGDGLPEPSGPPPQEETEPEPEEEFPLEPEPEKRDYGRLFLYLAYFLGAVILLLILYFAIERLIRVTRYRRAKEAQRYRILVKENLRLLSLMKIERSEDTTLTELSEKASAELELERDLRFIRDYESILYGGKNVTPVMVRTAGREQALLLRLLKKRDRLRAFYFKTFVRAA